MSKPTKMPADVAEAHNVLCRELLVLNTKWNAFKKLFCTDDESVQLLNSAASLFFQICREVFRDDVMMAVCRLTDPAETKAQSNLTLEYLVDIIPAVDASLVRTLRSLLTTVKTRCKGFRQYRNKTVGHFDRKTCLKRSASALPGLGLAEADEAFKSIADVLNAVEKHYDGNEQSYHEGIYGSGNAEELLEFIKRKNDLEGYFNRTEFG